MESRDPNADRKDQRFGGRISLQTLIIASVASAAASFAASRIWGAGTLVSAAVTPVLVALVSEFLRRPVQTVAETAKKVPTVQALPVVRNRTIAAPSDSTRVEDPTRVSTDRATGTEPQSPSERRRPREGGEAPAEVTPSWIRGRRSRPTPALGVRAGDWPSSPDCSRSRSSSLFTRSPTSWLDIRSPTTASRRRSSAVPRRRTGRQARRRR